MNASSLSIAVLRLRNYQFLNFYVPYTFLPLTKKFLRVTIIGSANLVSDRRIGANIIVGNLPYQLKDNRNSKPTAADWKFTDVAM